MDPVLATLTPAVDPDRDHVRGPLDAPVTLVEYGDFQCPDCVAAHRVVEGLLSRFEESLRFVFRHMPLTDLHPRAQVAAEAAEAAAAQGRFWDMHDHLFGKPFELSDEKLRRHAEAIGLDLARFDRDLAAGRHRSRVEQDLRSGARSGVPSTPRFFVDGVIHLGSPTRSALQERVLAELSREVV
jgi:NhaA family Na+:H+ antiporter